MDRHKSQQCHLADILNRILNVFMNRHQVPEANHQHDDQRHLAVRRPVGPVTSAGLGQLRAGAFRTRLLDRLDRLWEFSKPRHLHHGYVCTLHIPPLSAHPIYLLRYCLEAAQGVPVNPEQ